MQIRPLAAVVLAAGKGKRMRAPIPKVLLQACGRPLVEHVLAALEPLAADPVVVVYGSGGDAVPKALEGRGLLLAHQAEQLGTGHATQCALEVLGEFAGDVLVVCGDTPLLTSEVLEGLMADHRAARRALTVLSAEMEEPGGLGRILRGPDGRLRAIREATDASEEEREVREINTGVMAIAGERLPGALARLRADNAQGEYYLTDVPALLLEDGLAVGAFLTRDPGAAMGVNDPRELAEAERLLLERGAAPGG
jgi:bifunctional UDP-N-acetylglucosamine pyrophosphorylase/glucosamine-1-phosphate N-acetyltransferase